MALLVHVRLPNSDYVNLATAPRHNKQLNGSTEILPADTPNYSDYRFWPV